MKIYKKEESARARVERKGLQLPAGKSERWDGLRGMPHRHACEAWLFAWRPAGLRDQKVLRCPPPAAAGTAVDAGVKARRQHGRLDAASIGWAPLLAWQHCRCAGVDVEHRACRA